MRKYQRGQVLLIVVLVMTIALTIGLSLATRTITDIRTTTEEENSQRAFSAAEAGVEKALQAASGSTGSFTNNTSYDTKIETVSGVDVLLNNGNPILKDDAADVWLSTYPGYTSPWSGTVTIYWGTSADSCNTSEALNSMAALDILVLSGTKSSPQAAHFPVDPCSARSGTNNFETISSGGGTVLQKQFAFRRTITISSGLLIRVVPLYASTVVGVRGCNASGSSCTNLPAQSRLITSVGTADTTQRKLVVLQENPKLPVQIFPFILFSPK